MKSIYANGLVFWNEWEIVKRNQFIESNLLTVRNALKSINPAWHFIRIETPTLTTEISNEYEKDSYFSVNENLHLRPETTNGSYQAAKMIIEAHSKIKPPLCIWQSGKSYRNEQDKTLSHMRLKEFYQQEFQCVYSESTKVDYREPVLEALSKLYNAKVITSDRLPSYSESTIDIELNGMEIASLSIRKDFLLSGYKVLEIAIGLDRLVFQNG